MDNASQAARILDNFDFKGVSSCTIRFFLNPDNERPDVAELVFPSESENNFLSWSINEWDKYLEEQMTSRNIPKNGTIEAIQMDFCLEDSPKNGSYHIEARPFLRGPLEFNRLVFERYDKLLTSDERVVLRTARDVADYCNNTPQTERWNRTKIMNDLPEVAH
ncbi:hypothetical protein IKG10_02115 [Candidatus Saccharibacteria bacterium]|nr:hypothetical protein [Candidatus Saccharibacteria bacterium]